MTFDEYVDGKTIAVVGPAPLPYDQSAEIDGHDLVYRTTEGPLGGWYGSRWDIAYLNGGTGRQILDDDHRHYFRKIEHVDWWVYKTKHSRQYRPSGNSRLSHKPRIRNPNQITGILFDLVQYNPAHITVYGADLYASGPDKAYNADYDPRPAGVQAEFIIIHRPMEQFQVHQAVYKTGKIRGDDRYVAAVTMTTAEYQTVIDRWQAAYDNHQKTLLTLT
jgi:hypothetical protein